MQNNFLICKIAVPKSPSGFGFTVAWTKPPIIDFVNEGGPAEKSGVMPGDKIVAIDKIPVSKKGKEEIENIVKNVKEIMELEIIRPEGELSTRKRQTSLRRKESFTKKGTKMVIQGQTLNSDIYCQQLDRLKLVTDRRTARIGQQKKCYVPSRQRHTTHACSDSPETTGSLRKDSGLPRDCGLSFREIGSRVGRNQTAVMRICDRWMQEVSAHTIRRRLQQSGLSARCPLLGLPLTQNHRRLCRQWCDERRMWAAEWNEVVFTDESRICLQHHDGRIRV
ncbi:transposable element Tc1 transposase [Trichonephila clavipes]|nr:transposable element Tc1 transposase [Trichonephila clavipes]